MHCLDSRLRGSDGGWVEVGCIASHRIAPRRATFIFCRFFPLTATV